MKRGIPRRKERVLPRVGHRQDIVTMHMLPGRVANVLAAGRRRRLVGVAVGPLVPDEQVVLLAPQHAGEGLALDVAQVVG